MWQAKQKFGDNAIEVGSAVAWAPSNFGSESCCFLLVDFWDVLASPLCGDLNREQNWLMMKVTSVNWWTLAAKSS
jgi:hypothetical protein